jgi:hypothetical protein
MLLKSYALKVLKFYGLKVLWLHTGYNNTVTP